MNINNLLSKYIDKINHMQDDYHIPFHIPAKVKKKSNNIPHIIFQTWSSHIVPQNMYKTILDNLEKNPSFDYYLYDDSDCEKFLKENYNELILKTYNSLVPGAYKADFWRYCVMYKYGGVYLDIKFKIVTDMKQLIEKYNNTVFVKDSYRYESPNDVYQGLIISKPKLKIYKLIINNIIKNVESNYYGNNVLDPTGPKLFGDLIYQNNFNNLIKLNFHYPIIDMDENNNLIGRHVIKDVDDNILFENYPTYRIDQKNTFKNTKTKYYFDLWFEGKEGELNSNKNKDKNGIYFKGIYKN